MASADSVLSPYLSGGVTRRPGFTKVTPLSRICLFRFGTDSSITVSTGRPASSAPRTAHPAFATEPPSALRCTVERAKELADSSHVGVSIGQRRARAT